MLNLNRTALFFAIIAASVATGCSGGPTDPQDSLYEISIEGFVTDASNGSPVDESTVRVSYRLSEDCSFDSPCGTFTVTVASTVTNADGYYSMSFENERCSSRSQITQVSISATKPTSLKSALGFNIILSDSGTVFCREGLQEVDFSLEPRSMW